MIRAARLIARYFGVEVTRVCARWRGQSYDTDVLRDLEAHEQEILSRVEPFTMTSPERVAALIRAVRYISDVGLPGNVVECGVWRGGSMMAVALTLMAKGDTSRDLFLFDTFEGMPPPTVKDRDASGNYADNLLANTPAGTGLWCYAGLDEVRENLHATGYPPKKIHFVKGKVEETLPREELRELALVRLDTDWYTSTYHELIHLVPSLRVGGVLMLDDYGCWRGAKEATDQYFNENPQSAMYLHRVDSTGRIGVKCPPVSPARSATFADC